MKQSPNAPPGASKPPRAPSPDRDVPSRSHPDEGPALQVGNLDGGTSSQTTRAPKAVPARAAALLEPPGSAPSPFSPVAFNFADDTDAAEWLRLVRGNADDLVALAREGTRRLKHRVLARAEVRRQTREARRSMHGLLAEAEAGLARRLRPSHPLAPSAPVLNVGDALTDQFGTPLVVTGFRDRGTAIEMVMLRQDWPTPRPDGRPQPELGMSVRQALADLASGKLKRRTR